MDNGSTFGEGSWIFGLIVLLGLFGGFGGGFGGNNATMAGYATMADVNAAISNQTTQQALGAIQLSSANNNYETAQLISNQNMAMMQQSNSDLINAIQGFNSVTNSLNTGFASVNQNIANLGFKMEECCCSIKTLMLENRLQDAESALADARNRAVNAEQSQYLLSQMGRWQPYTATTALAL
jgi:hypothetical protein